MTNIPHLVESSLARFGTANLTYSFKGADQEPGVKEVDRGWEKERHPRKLELPVFDGEGADSWIFLAERYLTINRLIEMEKLEAVGVCFEGVAQAWLRFE